MSDFLHLVFTKSDACLNEQLEALFKQPPNDAAAPVDDSTNSNTQLVSNLNGLFLTNINYSKAELDLESEINLKESHNQN
jgi:hypothetical protein